MSVECFFGARSRNLKSISIDKNNLAGFLESLTWITAIQHQFDVFILKLSLINFPAYFFSFSILSS